MLLRTGWDSNPRWSYDTGLTVQTFRPLKQPILIDIKVGFEPTTHHQLINLSRILINQILVFNSSISSYDCPRNSHRYRILTIFELPEGFEPSFSISVTINCLEGRLDYGSIFCDQGETRTLTPKVLAS